MKIKDYQIMVVCNTGKRVMRSPVNITLCSVRLRKMPQGHWELHFGVTDLAGGAYMLQRCSPPQPRNIFHEKKC